jgi:hypothetical protein
LFDLNILLIYLGQAKSVRFVDIDGIDDHHCLNFLFIIIYLGQTMSVHFVDIDGIDDYHCFNFLFIINTKKDHDI